jgi:hypothetical protein
MSLELTAVWVKMSRLPGLLDILVLSGLVVYPGLLVSLVNVLRTVCCIWPAVIMPD